jgi:hypothetical protein
MQALHAGISGLRGEPLLYFFSEKKRFFPSPAWLFRSDLVLAALPCATPSVQRRVKGKGISLWIFMPTIRTGSYGEIVKNSSEILFERSPEARIQTERP